MGDTFDDAQRLADLEAACTRSIVGLVYDTPGFRAALPRMSPRVRRQATSFAQAHAATRAFIAEGQRQHAERLARLPGDLAVMAAHAKDKARERGDLEDRLRKVLAQSYRLSADLARTRR
ncbi:MAG: hypothetical protein HZB56_23845 [Deltaproteobacteria bacterium]|nr:hypothetical protein [Deltaproteobacteria bacterium]